MYILGYLLPHRTALWQTEVCYSNIHRSCETQTCPLDAHAPVNIHQTHYQCVRPQDLKHVTLMCEVFGVAGERPEEHALLGEARVRIRDICIESPTTMWLAVVDKAVSDHCVSLLIESM